MSTILVASPACCCSPPPPACDLCTSFELSNLYMGWRDVVDDSCVDCLTDVEASETGSPLKSDIHLQPGPPDCHWVGPDYTDICGEWWFFLIDLVDEGGTPPYHGGTVAAGNAAWDILAFRDGTSPQHQLEYYVEFSKSGWGCDDTKDAAFVLERNAAGSDCEFDDATTPSYVRMNP